MTSETQSESRIEDAAGRRAAPGALLVFSGSQPLFARIDLSTAVVWGRNDISGIRISDGQMSQAHLKVRFDAGRFVLIDSSRNGTYVNGARISSEQEVTARGGDVIRMGRTLVLLHDDVSEYRGYVERQAEPDGRTVIVGPRMRLALERAASARERARNLVILGENGAGKELIATHFHRAARKPGPLVPVNSATLKRETAAAVLFGSEKGAFTDVKASRGLIGEADGGVLFLDEIAELDDKVQSDFLRVLESGTYRVTGAREETRVQLSVVTASHQPLRERVKNGQFRQDLFHRLNQEQIELPALRERREEIPWLMALETKEGESVLHHSAVERALLLPWPGNLRELRSATANAVARALERFKEEAPARRLEGIKPEDDGAAEVRKIDFDANSGTELIEGSARTPVPATTSAQVHVPAAASVAPRASKDDPNRSKEVVQASLEKNRFNIKKTAEELGLNRTQLYREMDRHGIKRPGDDEPAAASPSGTLHDE